MAIHTVRTGDTLWSISRVYRVSISSIVEANGLSSEVIVPGLNLFIPDQNVPERFYQIRPGDTLWKLARDFRTSVEGILRSNPNINPYQLTIGQRIRIHTWQKYRMQTLIFVDVFDPNAFLNILSQIATHLTYIAVFTYSFNRDGSLNGIDDTQFISGSKRYNVKPLMVVSNLERGSFSPSLADQVLDITVRSILVRNIVNTVMAKGYDGVSIDIEFTPARRRNDFTAFLRELKTALGNRILHINAFSKTSDDPQNPISGVFDYRAIGQIVDIMAVMTIDYGYASGPPDPIAPIWWVEQVLRYSTGLVNRRKLMMAFPMYGYDWPLPDTPETTAAMISANSAQNRAIVNRVPIHYDLSVQAPSYTYFKNGQHKVWFEDSRSLVAKYEIMEVYNLLGATFWRLGFGFPQNWAYIEQNIEVEK